MTILPPQNYRELINVFQYFRFFCQARKLEKKIDFSFPKAKHNDFIKNNLSCSVYLIYFF